MEPEPSGSKPTIKNSGRKRPGGHASDKESPPAKRKQENQETKKRSGVAQVGGQFFELKMAGLIGLRGTKEKHEFEMETNAKGVGNFDDIVYTWRDPKDPESPTSPKRRYFMQLKHTDNQDTTTLVPSDLRPLLHKCFESYCSITDDPNFSDIPLERTEFIIYTNKQLGKQKLKMHNRQNREVDTIIKTCNEGEIFSFVRDNKEEIDVYTSLETLVKECDTCRNMIAQKQVSELEKISEFLNKLIMVTGQKGQEAIDDVIFEEIMKHNAVTVYSEKYKSELVDFIRSSQTWWMKKERPMIPESIRNWLQEAKNKACFLVVESMFNSCKQKFDRTEIKFSDTKISRFKDKLSKQLPQQHAVHIRSGALTLCSILLMDWLPQSKCIFVTFESLQSDENLLLHAWLGGNWVCLVVLCDSTDLPAISKTFLDIHRHIKAVPQNKYLIVVTARSVLQITDFVLIEHEFKFEQLSDESQKMVLDKKIDFQGLEVTMSSVLERHGNVQHVLGPELVTDLVTEGTTVNIGGSLQQKEGYYAPRVLERKCWLQTNLLKNTNDIIFVSGTTDKHLLKTLSSGKTVQSISLEYIKVTDFTQDVSTKLFLLSNKDAKRTFLAIGEKLEGKTLHWVEVKNQALLWKMSRGSIDSLLEHIDTDKTRADKRIIEKCMKSGSCEVNEDSIWDLGERTVLVVAEPGMGKSSTTTHVARHTKSSDHTSWVVRINWNDCSQKLEKINAEGFNVDKLVEFFSSVLFAGSKYCKVNEILLKQALQNSGNVTVLTDGYDEISPTYVEKAGAILTNLMETKVERVWVTSRPVVREKLEKKLPVIAFGMKKLSRESQEAMLRRLLLSKAGKRKVTSEFKTYIKKFIFDLNQSVYDENFTGSPLYITMIATVHVEKYLNSENWGLPNIELLNLYETFVEKTLLNYFKEKMKADMSISSVRDNYEEKKKLYLENFEKCALVAILPLSKLKSLHDKKIEDEIQPFLGVVQAGKDKTGIVMNVVDGRPQFVHRTFTEFFTARWFSRNFEHNRNVLEDILFDREYIFVRDMFDRILAKDCPLHCAVLEWDKERFKTLLDEACDVSATDKGGRTVVHIIASRNYTFPDIINRVTQYEASLDKHDRVLEWTPLQYAVKSGNWFIVERLLASNVDRSGWDMMATIWLMTEGTDYIDSIIIEAAVYGYLSLLEFLHSEGVLIHRARFGGFLNPLHAAIQVKQVPVITWLIEQGADCNTRYSDGKTPLFDAVTEGSLDVVKLLVEGGALVDIRDDYGKTVIDEAELSLMCASCGDDTENRNTIVSYLENVPRKKRKGSCIII